jgi:hypothetical protein
VKALGVSDVEVAGVSVGVKSLSIRQLGNFISSRGSVDCDSSEAGSNE